MRGVGADSRVGASQMAEHLVRVAVTAITTPYGGRPNSILELTVDQALKLIEAGMAVNISPDQPTPAPDAVVYTPPVAADAEVSPGDADAADPAVDDGAWLEAEIAKEAAPTEKGGK